MTFDLSLSEISIIDVPKCLESDGCWSGVGVWVSQINLWSGTIDRWMGVDRCMDPFNIIQGSSIGSIVSKITLPMVL